MKLRFIPSLAIAAIAMAAATSHFIAPSANGGTHKLSLNDDQIAKIIRHGPWPPASKPDYSNRVSGSALASELGRLLFFDPRLSRNGRVSCASCHDPKLGWTDGRARAVGIARVDRNTQSLFNVRYNRWFGLDGRTDSLWAHSIGPILAETEMGVTPAAAAALIRKDKTLDRLYRATFSRRAAGISPEAVLVDIAKALAAFQETIVSRRTAFDRFRDALVRQDFEAVKDYPAAAQRGAVIFFGRGKCDVCHSGAHFTNGEFDDAGVPYFTGPGRVDPGRHGGIRKLKSSSFNLLGRYNDDPRRANGWATRHVTQSHRTFGQFKVPSLRQLTMTAPYMHNGSLATLEDVVRHYSNINLDRIHSDGVRILKPLNLTDQQVEDLVSFLRTLSVPQSSNQRGSAK
jgi:cytochrome c peroxidase